MTESVPEYDDHRQPTEWIVAVSSYGALLIEAPNIHDSFLEETDLEVLGITLNGVPDLPAGLYKLTCFYWETAGFERPEILEDFGFTVMVIDCLWPAEVAAKSQPRVPHETV